eukprot:3867246-Rhodomonas_salina.1
MEPAGTYILENNNPNRRCLACPLGGVCDEGKFAAKDEASVWEVDEEVGVERLVTCPAGSMLVNSRDGTSSGQFAQELQDCRRCGVD